MGETAFVSLSYIFLGGISVLEDPRFDGVDRDGKRLVYKDMQGWYGADAYEKLTSSSNSCAPGSANPRSLANFNVIDAFLYAGTSVEGLSFGSSFSIRGGLIAESFNVVNDNSSCRSLSGTKSPVHGRPVDQSYIEYDWRLKTGKFPILERLGEAMAP